MPALETPLRRTLENVIVKARDVAEDAARAALDRLLVASTKPLDHLSDAEKKLRRALQAKERQLGSRDALIRECAYENWHTMLFARFLEASELLMHPDGVSVSMEDCAELAVEEGDLDAGGDPDGRAHADDGADRRSDRGDGSGRAGRDDPGRRRGRDHQRRPPARGDRGGRCHGAEGARDQRVPGRRCLGGARLDGRDPHLAGADGRARADAIGGRAGALEPPFVHSCALGGLRGCG